MQNPEPAEAATEIGAEDDGVVIDVVKTFLFVIVAVVTTALIAMVI